LVFQQSTVIMFKLTATQNEAGNTFGAIEFQSSSVTLNQFLIRENSANSSGGIGFSESNATLDNGQFESNDSGESVSCPLPVHSRL
jgi:hypothetical protein